MKKFLKIIAALVAFSLIICLLLFVNSSLGNPVSKLIAKISVKNYVEENYSDLDLKLEKAGYNLKFSSYEVFFRSETSEDTAFTVYSNSFGKITHDNYEHQVANNFTTWRRLDLELRRLGEKLISEKLPYSITNAYFQGEDMSTNDFNTILTKDMALDIKNPPFEIIAAVTINDEDVSFEKMAEVMRALAKLCIDENIPIKEYSVHIKNDALISVIDGAEARENQMLGIYNIPADFLNSENLADDLKNLYEKNQ